MGRDVLRAPPLSGLSKVEPGVVRGQPRERVAGCFGRSRMASLQFLFWASKPSAGGSRAALAELWRSRPDFLANNRWHRRHLGRARVRMRNSHRSQQAAKQRASSADGRTIRSGACILVSTCELWARVFGGKRPTLPLVGRCCRHTCLGGCPLRQTSQTAISHVEQHLHITCPACLC